MASWNDPSNSNPAHPNILSDLADKDSYALTMGQSGTDYTDLPAGTMTVDNGSKIFRRRESGVAEPFVISLAGGGTGAPDAEGARTALQVNKTGTGSAEARTNAQNDLRYLQSTNAWDNIKEAATDTETGVVKLNNTLVSTATDSALTAAQGKVLKDAVDLNTDYRENATFTTIWTGSSAAISDSDLLSSGFTVKEGHYIASSGGASYPITISDIDQTTAGAARITQVGTNIAINAIRRQSSEFIGYLTIQGSAGQSDLTFDTLEYAPL